MKKFKIFLFIIFTILLTSCSSSNIDISKNLTSIEKPDNKLDITGKWKLLETIDISTGKNTDEVGNATTLFISKKIFDFNDTYILEPNITSRYVNYLTYLNNKISKVPEKLLIKKDTTVVYKIFNNISYSQEFTKISDTKIITIDLGKVYIYEKEKNLSKKEIENKYNEIKSITDGKQIIKNPRFGLSIAFRNKKSDKNGKIDYDYYTYYIKKDDKDEKANILKVENIVIPKSSGLWTVSSVFNRNAETDYGKYTLSANSTFLDEDLKKNVITDSFYKRIDYVNKDYIAVTNFNYQGNTVSENYNIYNINNISTNQPLDINKIAGIQGNNIYLSKYKEYFNILSERQDLKNLDFKPNTSNIGIIRSSNNWKFISGIDQVIDNDKGSRLFRQFNLDITPVVNIGQSDSTSFSWREIISRKPGSIDAVVSPDKTYILIQTENSIELYPIFFNYIGNNPLFIIQNTKNYELVMSQWATEENINGLYNEYNKLRKINSYTIYPKTPTN
ncbi:hypothetical protein [Helcococcus ovis]|uniref:hypothetical protein n=2 Tax=Helcococcus ovis TaxID=72026 RepID=UPI0038BBA23F